MAVLFIVAAALLDTLIGTSTNLVVDGLFIRSGRPGLGMFEMAWVGVPCAVVGVAYVLLCSRWRDTLLLEAPPAFAKDQRNSRDFFLVSRLAEHVVPRHRKAWLAVLILVGMVAVATADLLPMVTPGMLAAGLMVGTRCLDWAAPKRALDLRALLVIAATLGVGTALEVSGAAQQSASGLIRFGGTDPCVLLVAVYGVTRPT